MSDPIIVGVPNAYSGEIAPEALQGGDYSTYPDGLDAPVEFNLVYLFTNGYGNANDPGAAVLIGSTLYFADLDVYGDDRSAIWAQVVAGTVIEVGDFNYVVAAVQDNVTHWQFEGAFTGDPPPDASEQRFTTNPFTYTQGSWWRYSSDGLASVPGLIAQTYVEAGDRLIVKNEAPTAEGTTWSLLRFADAPWDHPASPLAGCELPFWPGRRLVVEAFYYANPPAAPSECQNVQASATNTFGEVVLTWDQPATGEVVAYQVEALDPMGSSTWVPVQLDGDRSASHTWPTDADDTPEPGYMRVRAIGVNSLQGPSTTVFATPKWPDPEEPDQDPPARPTVTSWKPEGSYGKMVVRFKTSAADNYEYSIATQNGSNNWVYHSWTRVGNNQNVVKTMLTGSAGTTYRVKVRVRDAVGNTSAYTASYYYVLKPQIQSIVPTGSTHWRTDRYGADIANPKRIYQGYFSNPADSNIGMIFYGWQWSDATLASSSFGGRCTVVWGSVTIKREGGGSNTPGNINVATHAILEDPGGVIAPAPALRFGSTLGTLVYGESKTFYLTAGQLADLTSDPVAGVGLALYGQPYLYGAPVGDASAPYQGFGSVSTLG